MENKGYNIDINYTIRPESMEVEYQKNGKSNILDAVDDNDLKVYARMLANAYNSILVTLEERGLV